MSTAPGRPAAADATLREWLERHPDLPRLERELLACHRLSLQRAALIADPDLLVTPAELTSLNVDADRLRRGEPLAYVTGERGFWDFTLAVSPAVLVPRPETETLVERALVRTAAGSRVLDLGTGSGAIAIAMALNTDARVTAVDASAAALAVARDNAARLDATVQFRIGNWLDGVRDRFDLILANPPYVAEEDPHLTDLAFEPRSALVSGPAGLDDLTIIIRDAPRALVPGGWLMVEHGYDQAEAVRARFTAAGFEAVTLTRDLGGRPRVTEGRHPGGQAGPIAAAG